MYSPMYSGGREYPEEVELKYNDIVQLLKAQETIYSEGFKNDVDTNDLSWRLGGYATAMGFLAMARNYTALGWATTIVAVLTEMTFNGRTVLRKYLDNGNTYLINLLNFMDNNKEYDIIRVKLPFLQYYHVDGDIRFVIGEGQITGVHYRRGGWSTDQ
ncbi:hypothetical protein J27TS7_39770 [Paenibacillus dendritiformis]|uniref:hypothetical protein n=1 Tax=Paenibacillus dendritiformis TaxID=130049 RepID=UPI00143D2D2D|nr:hypothetical protein [Paenibacillus dendritiformis]MBG9796025.1 hypothetical protein [Paenibacillus dendritiformis]NKI21386.1 hypothetical protein [Paenibacillus dendritiformis]NRF97538.1 hypothetical protein [Paenibacillus dendritiformis]GIO74463.1 hypothetical protein J27TS7_39770 [Paenibacillus dendritiformis]